MKKLRITIDGQTYDVQVEVLDETGNTLPDPASGGKTRSVGSSAPTIAPAAPAAAAPAAGGGAGDVPSPLAGIVVSVDVQAGQAVAVGDKLLTLEAMKMNTIVSAPAAGSVSAIHVSSGDAVEEGQALVTVN